MHKGYPPAGCRAQTGFSRALRVSSDHRRVAATPSVSGHRTHDRQADPDGLSWELVGECALIAAFIYLFFLLPV